MYEAKGESGGGGAREKITNTVRHGNAENATSGIKSKVETTVLRQSLETRDRTKLGAGSKPSRVA